MTRTKIISVLAGAAALGGASLGTAAPAQAWCGYYGCGYGYGYGGGAVAAGLVGGLVVGAIAASAAQQAAQAREAEYRRAAYAAGYQNGRRARRAR